MARQECLPVALRDVLRCREKLVAIRAKQTSSGQHGQCGRLLMTQSRIGTGGTP
jgi:hypothetical protein